MEKLAEQEAVAFFRRRLEEAIVELQWKLLNMGAGHSFTVRRIKKEIQEITSSVLEDNTK